MNFIRKYHALPALLIALLSFCTAILYNEANIHALKAVEQRDHLVKLDPSWRWVATIDDAAYIRPAENYYHYHTWRDNNPGRQAYFLRTPGYGLFRYGLMCLLGFDAGQLYFRYVQVLLFALSVFLLYRVALLMGLPPRWALGVGAIYGLTPFAIGFLYYSLTEGITPALMIGYTFLLLSAYRRRGAFFYLVAALLMGYIGLVRPVLLIFAAALPVMIWWSTATFTWARRLTFVLINIAIIALPLTMWAYRTYQIAGQWVSIYPIYYSENNSQFRPSHQAIWRFASSFGMTGQTFHEGMVPLWQATIHGDTSEIHIDSILLTIPDFVKNDIGEQRLKSAYRLYRSSIAAQRRLYPIGTAMPDTILATEQAVVRDFDAFTSQIRYHFPFQYHILVPLSVFRLASLHSNLSLWIFQHTWRGTWWMEALRLIFLLLHVACCFSFLYFLWTRDRVAQLLFGWLIAAYFFYLCYFFRGLEERYTLPLLPLMLLAFMVSLQNLLSKISISFNKKVPAVQ
ncbi:MAG: hypothetical protein JST83_11320 [Bacteroidetes bacterium]|nr:hypothetical protein [Bacteroidota bacterium]